MSSILQIEDKYKIKEFLMYIKDQHLLATAMALVLSYKIVNISKLIGQIIFEENITHMEKIKIELVEFIIATVLIFLMFNIARINEFVK